MVLKEFGKRLENQRKKAGYPTRESFARAMKTTNQTIGNYEMGIRDPKGQTLLVMAKKLGCTVDYLVGLEDATTHDLAYIVKETGLSEETIRFLKDFSEFDKIFVPIDIKGFFNFLLSEKQKEQWIDIMLYLSKATKLVLLCSSHDSVISKYSDGEKLLEEFSVEELRQKLEKIGYSVFDSSTAKKLMIRDASEKLTKMISDYVDDTANVF